jgi:hypothetical protein
MNFTVHMIFFDLHHSGTQFFLGKVDIFSTRKFASSILRGGKHPNSQSFFASFNVHRTKQSVSVRCFNVHKKSSQCADVKYLTSTSVYPVCDLNVCDLNFESAL